MMATKPTTTTSLRDRRISPSPSLIHHSSLASRPARPSPKTSLSGRDNTSPPDAKKPARPNHLKPKAVPSSESPVWRIPTITASATSKTPSARRLADRAPPPSTSAALQRSLKPAARTPKRSSSFKLHGDKAAHNVSRTARTSLVHKTKSTSPTLAKRKDAPLTIAATSLVKISSDDDAESTTAFERPVQEQLWNNHKKVVEESNFISSLIEEENHNVEQKSGEPENCGEVLVPQVFDEVSKDPVVLEEVPEQAAVAAAAASQVLDPQVRKPRRLGAAVATVVTAMPAAAAKKDAPISNVVIEETKSKLMERRKNKVLALVGAFETVISLQEPEDQVIQKALQVQHGQQIQQDLQVEQSFQDAQINAQQLEAGDEVHQDQQRQVNGEHHEKEKEEENVRSVLEVTK